jgi:hypothetical protein
MLEPGSHTEFKKDDWPLSIWKRCFLIDIDRLDLRHLLWRIATDALLRIITSAIVTSWHFGCA